MYTNDEIFMKEFTNMMKQRRSSSFSTSLRVVDLPVNKMPTLREKLPKAGIVLIRGIRENYFDKLNDEEVILLGKSTLKKRLVNSDGSFRKESDGSYSYKVVKVPKDSVAVFSKRPIGLKRFIEENGRRVKVAISEGFEYVDFTEKGGVRYYKYIIPKRYAYRLTFCSLIVTTRPRRTYYQGFKVVLTTGVTVYVYSIPSSRVSADVKVVGHKPSPLFEAEIKSLLGFWITKGVMFDPTLTSIDSIELGSKNLVYSNLPATIDEADYLKMDVSMLDEKVEDEWDE